MRARLKKIFTHKVLNPFDTVRYKGNFKPDSRTLHTSFKEKMWDTYQVLKGGTVGFKTEGIRDLISLYSGIFRGQQVSLENIQLSVAYIRIEETPFKLSTRPGLFDYATLGIFRLFHGLNHFCKWVLNYNYDEAHIYELETPKFSGAKKIGINIAKVLIFIPAIAINLIHHVGNSLLRPLVSGILTLAVSPLVGLAHFISQRVKRYKENKLAESLDVTVESTSENNSTSIVTKKFSEVLAEKKISFQDISIDIYNIHAEQSKDTLAFTAPFKGRIATKLFDMNNPTQKKQYSTLAEVNKFTRMDIHGYQAVLPRHR